MIEQECETIQTYSTKLEPLLQQEVLLPITIKTEHFEPDSDGSMSPPLIKVKEDEDDDDREINASNSQAATNPDITIWNSTRTPQLLHLVAQVKEENPPSLHSDDIRRQTEPVEPESNDSMSPSCIKVKEENPSCDDIYMQTKSNGVSSFNTTMENSTETPEVTDKTPCPVCGEIFANIMQYTHHLNVHSRSHEQPAEIKNECTEQLHECLNCLEIFPMESDLAAHKMNCSELYKCAKCGKKCESENKLEMHMKYMCKSRMLDQSFVCRLCKKSFLGKYDLARHVNAVHHKLKTFSCTLCDRSFLYESQLKSHVDAVHSKLKPFTCTLCHKSFAQKGALNQHIKAVHLKAFSCTLCHKSFASKHCLAQHVDGHKLKRYFCTLCDKSFTQSGSLPAHIDAVHRKIRPFTCTLCDKSFGQKTHLTRHVKIVHEGLKPFSCTLCDKSFSERGNLTKHTDSVHHKKKPFSCTLCEKSFARKQQLTVHVHVMH